MKFKMRTVQTGHFSLFRISIMLLTILNCNIQLIPVAIPFKINDFTHDFIAI